MDKKYQLQIEEGPKGPSDNLQLNDKLLLFIFSGPPALENKKGEFYQNSPHQAYPTFSPAPQSFR
jgi:hypothetical protein